jgi:hypothetical protein
MILMLTLDLLLSPSLLSCVLGEYVKSHLNGANQALKNLLTTPMKVISRFVLRGYLKHTSANSVKQAQRRIVKFTVWGKEICSVMI